MSRIRRHFTISKPNMKFIEDCAHKHDPEKPNLSQALNRLLHECRERYTAESDKGPKENA